VPRLSLLAKNTEISRVFRRFPHRNEFDVVVIFSQDQDLSELASLIRQVAGFQNRWIKMASAFPDTPTAANRRGINRTDWCPTDKSTYDACIDPRDYPPRP
jgi:hypothetical protein